MGKINKTCCFLGPQIIPKEKFEKLNICLIEKINLAIKNGYDRFLCGFSDGADLMAAGIVAEFKKYNENIELIAVLRNKERVQEKSLAFRTYIKKCSRVHICSEINYDLDLKGKIYQMIDMSRRVVVVLDKHHEQAIDKAVDYAEAQKKEVVFIRV